MQFSTSCGARKVDYTNTFRICDSNRLSSPSRSSRSHHSLFIIRFSSPLPETILCSSEDRTIWMLSNGSSLRHRVSFNVSYWRQQLYHPATSWKETSKGHHIREVKNKEVWGFKHLVSRRPLDVFIVKYRASDIVFSKVFWMPCDTITVCRWTSSQYIQNIKCLCLPRGHS